MLSPAFPSHPPGLELEGWRWEAAVSVLTLCNLSTLPQKNEQPQHLLWQAPSQICPEKEKKPQHSCLNSLCLYND